jgi:hypothetical protein
VHLEFNLGTALSRNPGTQLSCRSLAGFGASIILSIYGASIADIFELGGEVLRGRLWPQVHFSVPRPLLLFQNS